VAAARRRSHPQQPGPNPGFDSAGLLVRLQHTDRVPLAALMELLPQFPDAAAYAGELAKIRAVMTRLGSKSTMRVWRSRFAGPDAGAIVVSIEYPDMATFAAEDAKVQGDAEYASLLKGLDRVRKIVSDSLYEELK
jgi:hypothetical protein